MERAVLRRDDEERTVVGGTEKAAVLGSSKGRTSGSLLMIIVAPSVYCYPFKERMDGSEANLLLYCQ